MPLQSPPRPTHSQVLGYQQEEDEQQHHPYQSEKEKQNQEQQNPHQHQQEQQNPHQHQQEQQQQQLHKIKKEQHDRQDHEQEKEHLCQNQQQQQQPNQPECQQKLQDRPNQEQQHRQPNQQEQNTHQNQQEQQQQHPHQCKQDSPNSYQYQHEQHNLKKQKKEQQEANLNHRQPKQEQSSYNDKQGQQQHPHQDQEEQHHHPSQHCQQLTSQHQHQNHDHQHLQHPHQFLQYPHHDQQTPQHFHQHQQHPHLHQQQSHHDHHTPQQQHKKRGLVCMYPEVRTAIAPTVHYITSPPAQLGGTFGSSPGNVQLSQYQQCVQGSAIHESPIVQHIYPPPLASHGEVVGNKDLFLTTLSKFHAALGTKLSIPRIGGKDLDLHLLYKEVTARGGLEMVIKDRKWKEITLVFNFPPTTTSASFVLRKYYFYLLHQYEQVYFFQLKGPVVPSPVPLPSVSPVSYSLSETECTHSPSEGPVVAMKKQKIDSAQALGVDPASSIGSVVTGHIDGKFEHGYLVNVTVGTRKMRGVLYHVPPSSTVPQHATVSPCVNSLGNELKASVMEHRVEHRRKKKLMTRKDPNAPRQNRTGYNFFFAEQRARLKSTQPDKDRAISKMIGDLWNSLSEDEKLPYQERGIQEKERYKREMCEYKERLRLQAQGVVVGTSSSLSSLQMDTKRDHMSDIDLNIVKSVELKQELIPYQEQVVQPLSESSSVTSSSNHQTLVPGNSDVNVIKNLSPEDGYPATADSQGTGKKSAEASLS